MIVAAWILIALGFRRLIDYFDGDPRTGWAGLGYTLGGFGALGLSFGLWSLGG